MESKIIATKSNENLKLGFNYFIDQELTKLNQNNFQGFSKINPSKLIQYFDSLWVQLSLNEQQYYYQQELVMLTQKEHHKRKFHEIHPKFKSQSKRCKPSDAPKRSMSAFLLYSQQYRSILHQDHPDLKNTEISTILAKNWKSMLQEDKQPYLDKELLERKQYHENMKHYKLLKEFQCSSLQSNEPLFEFDEEIHIKMDSIDQLTMNSMNSMSSTDDSSQPSHDLNIDEKEMTTLLYDLFFPSSMEKMNDSNDDNSNTNINNINNINMFKYHLDEKDKNDEIFFWNIFNS